jgi:polar amino acid transport system substrate-binding protein
VTRARAAALALGLCASSRVTAPQTRRATPRRVVDIAAEDAAGNWSRKDGTGFANDIVRAAFAAAGVDARFIVVPYARCKQMVVDASMVACFSMSRTGLDASVVLPSLPLFTCFSDYFVRTGTHLPAGGAPFVPGTVVGVVRGYEYPASVQSLVDRGIIKLEEGPSEETNLQKLAQGRIGAALINYNRTKPATEIVAAAGVAGKVVAGPRAGELGSFIGFSRRHPDMRRTLAAFDSGLLVITRTGEMARIEERWVRLALSRAGPK